jgi:hypothetical protein
MWVNPKHPDPPRRSTPPPETGRRLLALPRGDREELRVTLDEFNGHPYLAVRVWQRDQGGSWWPTRKGVSVRLSEARDVADALSEAVDLVETRAADSTRRTAAG